MNYAIETHKLSKLYGKELKVKNLSLSIPSGCVYGFLGPNGAGKTTTMKMMLGLIKPTNGEVLMMGHPMNKANRISILRQTGSLIETPSYYGHLTGKENLEIVCQLKNVPYTEINEVLEIVKMTQYKNQKTAEYSLGMKQRLGIACALLGHPKVLLLDEPTNGLDPAGIQEIRELICELPKQYGITVLVSSHLLSEIDQMANVVGIIDHGELLFQNDLTKLHAQSKPTLHIKTMDDVAAKQLLLRSNIDCERSADQLIMPYVPDDKIAFAIELLVQHQIGVTRIEEHQRSLEDIFLDITERRISLS